MTGWGCGGKRAIRRLAKWRSRLDSVPGGGRAAARSLAKFQYRRFVAGGRGLHVDVPINFSDAERGSLARVQSDRPNGHPCTTDV